MLYLCIACKEGFMDEYMALLHTGIMHVSRGILQDSESIQPMKLDSRPSAEQRMW